LTIFVRQSVDINHAAKGVYPFFVCARPGTQWVKSPKNSLKERVFVNSALKIQCHIVKKYTPTDCFFDAFSQLTAQIRLPLLCCTHASIWR